MNELAVIFLGTIIFVLSFFVWRLITEIRQLRIQNSAIANEAQSLRTRYSSIIDLDAELTVARNKLAQAKRDHEEFDSQNERQRAKLSQEYDQALTTYNGLKKEISLLEEKY